MSDSPIQQGRRMGEKDLQARRTVRVQPRHPENCQQKREVTDGPEKHSGGLSGTEGISGMQNFRIENWGQLGHPGGQAHGRTRGENTERWRGI